MRKDTYEADKVRVLEWLQKYAHGYKNARTRENILPFVQMEDRKFRMVISDLIHEGNACSSHKRGYWFFPLHTNDHNEIEAFKECHIERKAKAINLIEDCDKLIYKAEEMLQNQKVLL